VHTTLAVEQFQRLAERGSAVERRTPQPAAGSESGLFTDSTAPSNRCATAMRTGPALSSARVSKSNANGAPTGVVKRNTWSIEANPSAFRSRRPDGAAPEAADNCSMPAASTTGALPAGAGAAPLPQAALRARDRTKHHASGRWVMEGAKRLAG